LTQATAVSIHVSDIPSLVSDPDEGGWKPVRHHFGIRSFGVNAYIAKNEDDPVFEEHNEIEDSGTRHEELFFVANGEATFTVSGETVDAPAGTFVYVRDPAATRSAVARSAGTTVLAFGGEPGVAFDISPWEQKYID
jgi:hypothetical protein